MYGRAIPQVDADGKGIHVLWFGPTRWGYSPGGWIIERRKYPGSGDKPACNFLNSNELALLQDARERRLDFGVVTLEDGFWPEPLQSGGAPPKPARVFRVRLDRAFDGVDVTVLGVSSFAYALRGGKVVATSGPLSSATHHLREIGIDTVVVHSLALEGLTICVLPDDPQGGGDCRDKVPADSKKGVGGPDKVPADSKKGVGGRRRGTSLDHPAARSTGRVSVGG